jgi:phosphatidylinositol alpha-mannosyltransferase
MKIALISLHSFLKPGGVKSHILGLSKELKKRGHKTKIIVPRQSFQENYGRGVILLGTSFPLSFGGGESDFAFHFNQTAIEEVLEKEKFDVLHFHNFGFPSSFQILEKSKALNILTFHSDVERSKLLLEFPILLEILRMVINWKIDGVIGVSEVALKFLNSCRVPTIVIPNGIDLEIFNSKARKIKKFLDGRINILFVGRIEERKGLIYLLRAYRILEKKFQNLRLIIIGEGELKEKCQDFVRKHNLKEVYFEGEKTDRELVSYYKTADIFCAPSIYGESFGIVLLEAMACRLPMVAFANEGYKEFFRGKKGEKFLAKTKDFRDLAKKLEILIENHSTKQKILCSAEPINIGSGENLRKEMGKWGESEAKKYSWEKICNKILNFYQLCQKEKTKKEKESFSPEKLFEKLDKENIKDLNDILKWLR